MRIFKVLGYQDYCQYKVNYVPWQLSASIKVNTYPWQPPTTAKESHIWWLEHSFDISEMLSLPWLS